MLILALIRRVGPAQPRTTPLEAELSFLLLKETSGEVPAGRFLGPNVSSSRVPSDGPGVFTQGCIRLLLVESRPSGCLEQSFKELVFEELDSK